MGNELDIVGNAVANTPGVGPLPLGPTGDLAKLVRDGALDHEEDILTSGILPTGPAAVQAQPTTITAKFNAPGLTTANTSPMFPTKLETPPPQPVVVETKTPAPMTLMSPARPADLMQQPASGMQLDTNTMLTIGGGAIILVLLLRT